MDNLNHKKRKERIRRKLKSVNTSRFRLSVHRSLRNISAQIIDDKNHKTLLSVTSLKKDLSNKKKNQKHQVILLNCWLKKL